MDLSFTLILYGVITCTAALVHGAVGIGFPMVATPLLAMAADVKTAVLILVLPTIFINGANILRGGQWKKSIGRYWPLAVYGIAGSFLGTRLLVTFPPDFFRPVLAGVIILYLNSQRLGMGSSWISSRPHTAMALFGTTAGLLGGTVNVMLPALVIFALEVKMNKTAMIQLFNLCFLLGKLTQGTVLVTAGFFTMEILKISAPLTVLALIITAAGMKIRDRIPAASYQKWLRRLLMAMAVILIIQSLGV